MTTQHVEYFDGRDELSSPHFLFIFISPSCHYLPCLLCLLPPSQQAQGSRRRTRCSVDPPPRSQPLLALGNVPLAINLRCDTSSATSLSLSLSVQYEAGVPTRATAGVAGDMVVVSGGGRG